MTISIAYGVEFKTLNSQISIKLKLFSHFEEIYKITLKSIFNSPVLTNLNETLLCVLSASLKLGCTKSFSAPPLDEAILFALELNPRHANTRRLDFDDSENIKGKRKIRKLYK